MDIVLENAELDNTDSENFPLPLGDDLIVNHWMFEEVRIHIPT